MNINLDPELPYHLAAAGCVIVSFFALRIGYDKNERAFIREQKRLWKEDRERVPRAWDEKQSGKIAK